MIAAEREDAVAPRLRLPVSCLKGPRRLLLLGMCFQSNGGGAQ